MARKALIVSLTSILVILVGMRLRSSMTYAAAREAINASQHEVQTVEPGRFVALFDTTELINDFDRAPFLDEATREELSAVGIEPDLKGLVGLYTYRMPPYAWFDTAANRRALYLGRIKQTLSPHIASAIAAVESKTGEAYVAAFHEVEEGHICLYTEEDGRIYSEIRQRK